MINLFFLSYPRKISVEFQQLEQLVDITIIIGIVGTIIVIVGTIILGFK